MPSFEMDKSPSVVNMVKEEKGSRKRSKSATDGPAADGAISQYFGRRGYYLAQSPPGLQMLPFHPMIQPHPHQFIAPMTVGAQHPAAHSGVPLAVIPWPLPFPICSSLHGQTEPSLPSPHVFNPNGPHLVFPPNSVAGFRTAPVDLLSPTSALKMSSTFVPLAARKESHSSDMDSRHSLIEGVLPVGDVETARLQSTKQQRLHASSGARDRCNSFSICIKHERTRKTRLRPDSSLRTGKRKYRCETCTAILEQWTETYGARPTDAKKQELLSLVGMTSRQLNYWFANRRRTERLAHAQETGIMTAVR